MHTELDRAVLNAEKNKSIQVDEHSERRSQSTRVRNGSVRFNDGGASKHGTAFQTNTARTLLHSKGQSSQVLAYTKRYRESLQLKSGNEHVDEVKSGHVGEFAGFIHVEWTRLCQEMDQNPFLAELAGNMGQSFDRFLRSKQLWST